MVFDWIRGTKPAARLGPVGTEHAARLADIQRVRRALNGGGAFQSRT